jgi:hypothetical protein
MPVLPAVPSTITPPGRKVPRFSASRTIANAARSLIEPPGLRNSALPKISQPVSSESRRKRMRGVLPMVGTKPSRRSIAPLGQHDPRRSSSPLRGETGRVEVRLRYDPLQGQVIGGLLWLSILTR